MSLEQWHRVNRWVEPRSATPEEIRTLWKVVQRELADAAVTGLSSDSSFVHAYDACLALGTVDVASPQQAAELRASAGELREKILAWLRTSHPHLVPPGS